MRPSRTLALVVLLTAAPVSGAPVTWYPEGGDPTSEETVGYS